VGVARFILLPYVCFLALGGVRLDAAPPPPVSSQLQDGVAARDKQLQADDDSQDGDDDELADADFDEDFVPSTTPAIAPAAPTNDRLTLVPVHAPLSAAIDPLFRPPRLASA
jgi:hypothetical protein